MNPPTGPECPRYALCANADSKCHLCKAFSCFKPGHGYGKGKRTEQAVAKSRNKEATLRRGSGAVAHAKGDVLDSTALHEVKSGYAASKGSFRIQRAWLLKIEKEALAENRIPLLDFHFDGAPDSELWTVINSATLFDILRELSELRAKDATDS